MTAPARPTSAVTAPARPTAAVALGLLATLAGGLLYRGFFAGTGYLVPLLVAAVAGIAFGLLAGRRGSPAGLLLAGCGIAALLTAYLAFPGTLWHGLPGVRTAAAVLAGVGGGWARMLSARVPTGAVGELLVAPLLTHFGAAAGATVLAVRTRSAVAPVAPPLASFVVALVLSGPAVVDSLPATTLLVVAAAATLAVRRSGRPAPADRGGRGGPGRIGAALAPAVLVAVVALATAGLALGPVRVLAAGADRADAGRLLRPPVRVAPVVDPLSTVRVELRRNPPRPLFSLEVVAGPPAALGDRVRLMALDRYDGVLWSTDARHLPVGRAPAGGGTGTDTGADEVRFRVTLDGLAGPFLPVAGRPYRVDAQTPGPYRFAVADDPATLVTDPPGAAGLGYAVTARVRPADAGFDAAVPDGAADPRLRELPGEPPRALAELLDRLTAPAARPVDKLRAVERHLRSLPYDLDAPPGHSYAALAVAGGGAGHAEQRAAAFAVLARMLGYPARVVVGFRLPPGERGRYAVTTREAHAWPEVRFAGYGWMPFEPTGDSPAVPGRVAPVPPPATPAPDPSPSAVATPVPEAPAWVGSAGLGRVLPLLVAPVLLGVLALPLVPLARALRRRRRRTRGTTTSRLAGAWAETMERLRYRRVPLTSAMTPVEIAREAARRVPAPAGAPGPPELTLLAGAVTAAFFDVTAPDEPAVRAAWDLEAVVRRWLRYPPTSYRRYLASFDPRPFLAHRRPSRGWWRSRADRYRASPTAEPGREGVAR
ncbi:transglutaminase-like domain-containing protein [Micromonospora sp. NPDC049559]|uniref:transglutaminase-like domain-containing protein n=1 Tax=Micromonospora sp. NPDC049559 TaxID=3155923 RepID=UPI0034392827